MLFLEQTSLIASETNEARPLQETERAQTNSYQLHAPQNYTLIYHLQTQTYPPHLTHINSVTKTCLVSVLEFSTHKWAL